MVSGTQVNDDRQRRLAPALLAVLALMIQALIPSAAMAARMGAGPGQATICTGMGVQTVAVPETDGQSQKGGFAGMPCADCLAAACAAIVTPDVTVARVAYATAWDLQRPRVELTPRTARAPPRPPGQGPPAA